MEYIHIVYELVHQTILGDKTIFSDCCALNRLRKIHKQTLSSVAYLPFKEIITDRQQPTNRPTTRPTNQQTDILEG